jgi:hypothetical protein
LFHPATITQRVGRVHNSLYEIVADDYASVTPVTFDLLRLVTGAKVIYDFQACVGKQRGRVRFLLKSLSFSDYLSVPLWNGNIFRPSGYAIPERLHVIDLVVNRQSVEASRRNG